MEDKPVAVSRSSAYRHNVGDSRFLLPVIIDEDGDNSLVFGLLPGRVRRYSVQKVFD